MNETERLDAELGRVLDHYAARYDNYQYSLLVMAIDQPLSVPPDRLRPDRETRERIKSLALDAAVETCEIVAGFERPHYAGKILEAMLAVHDTFGQGQVMVLLVNFLRPFQA